MATWSCSKVANDMYTAFKTTTCYSCLLHTGCQNISQGIWTILFWIETTEEGRCELWNLRLIHVLFFGQNMKGVNKKQSELLKHSLTITYWAWDLRICYTWYTFSMDIHVSQLQLEEYGKRTYYGWYALNINNHNLQLCHQQLGLRICYAGYSLKYCQTYRNLIY